jgi:hypothetical protein
MQTYHHYIDGGEVEPDAGEWLDSVDPYLGEPWARIARDTAADVDRAVTAAARAMRDGPWASITATERGKLLVRRTPARQFPRDNDKANVRASSAPTPLLIGMADRLPPSPPTGVPTCKRSHAAEADVYTLQQTLRSPRSVDSHAISPLAERLRSLVFGVTPVFSGILCFRMQLTVRSPNEFHGSFGVHGQRGPTWRISSTRWASAVHRNSRLEQWHQPDARPVGAVETDYPRQICRKARKYRSDGR